MTIFMIITQKQAVSTTITDLKSADVPVPAYGILSQILVEL